MSYHTANDPGQNGRIGGSIEKKNQTVQTIDSYCYFSRSHHDRTRDSTSNIALNLTVPLHLSTVDVTKDSISKPVANSAAVPVDVDSLDDIGKLVHRMTSMLHDLQSTYHTHNTSEHRMDAERFQKLI